MTDFESLVIGALLVTLGGGMVFAPELFSRFGETLFRDHDRSEEADRVHRTWSRGAAIVVIALGLSALLRGLL